MMKNRFIMTIFTKGKKEFKPKKMLKILKILFLIAPILIQSQNILDSDSTKISYKELTEVAKFIAFKDSSESIFKMYRAELSLKDSILMAKDQRINIFQKKIIPSLESIISKKDSININKSHLIEISDLKLKHQRKQKFIWGGYGAIIGLVLSVIFIN